MIRTKPPSDEYRDGWDRVFGDDDARIDRDVLDKYINDALKDGVRAIRESGANWPTAHESDCPAATGDGSCRCPMGNL